MILICGTWMRKSSPGMTPLRQGFVVQAGGKSKNFVIPAQAGTGSEKFYLHNLGPVVKPRDDNGGSKKLCHSCAGRNRVCKIF